MEFFNWFKKSTKERDKLRELAKQLNDFADMDELLELKMKEANKEQLPEYDGLYYKEGIALWKEEPKLEKPLPRAERIVQSTNAFEEALKQRQRSDNKQTILRVHDRDVNNGQVHFMKSQGIQIKIPY